MDRQEAIKILKRHAPDTKSFNAVLKHSLAVERYAVRLAKEISKHRKVDVDFVSTASILHDIGRFNCPPWKCSDQHGIKGAQLLRKERLPERYAKVCERHLGSGIRKSDILKQKLKLPLKQYVPLSVEEKIICYADKRVEMDKLVPISLIVRRYTDEFGAEQGRRIQMLHEQIQKLYKPGRKAKRHQKSR